MIAVPYPVFVGESFAGGNKGDFVGEGKLRPLEDLEEANLPTPCQLVSALADLAQALAINSGGFDEAILARPLKDLAAGMEAIAFNRRRCLLLCALL